MKIIDCHMSTDSVWEEWGLRDPHFGVITDPKFRRSSMTDDTNRELFESARDFIILPATLIVAVDLAM
jgi:hypothetical protein